jgi:diguanylate cyclase (GGDEF)-like protein
VAYRATHVETVSDPIDAAVADIAREWMAELSGSTYPAGDPAVIRHWLAGLVARLVDVLCAETFDATPASEVGAALVEGHLTDSDVLVRTAQALDRRLPDLVCAAGAAPDETAARSRLVLVTAALCAGFADALRRRASADQHHLHLQLRHQAYHDPLTGLPNRALLAERIQQLFRTADPGSRAGLCFLDLDGFKQVNDLLGHDMGDRLLSAVADRMHACVAGQGHLLARVGGDEFVILVAAHASPGAAVAIADQVMRALAAPFRLGDHVVRISASIGVVERPIAMTGPAELMRAADLTMYRAKRAGKGRWAVFDHDRGHRALPATLPSTVDCATSSRQGSDVWATVTNTFDRPAC